MSQKWNLQDIRPPEARRQRRSMSHGGGQSRSARPTRSHPTDPDSESIEPALGRREDIPSIVIEDGNKKSRYRFITAIVVFVVIVGASLFAAASLGKTELVVYPEFRTTVVNGEFVAYPEQRPGELTYGILEISTTSEAQVTATGQVMVEAQATGTIEIVKTTPGAQRLIASTRFRASDDLVYRIQESVVVPGAVEDASGGTVPGNIQAEVYAVEIGEEYNLPAGTRFDIPGFEEAGETALFNAMYATNPSPIAGGYNGPRFQIDEAELSTSRQALQMEMRRALNAAVEEQRPAGTVILPGSVTITYYELPSQSLGDDNLVYIREEAVLQVPYFTEVALGSFIADKTVNVYEGNDVVVDDPSALTFEYTDPTQSNRPIANETSLSFSLEGRPLLIWTYDAEQLRIDLAGLPKTAAPNAFAAMSGVRGGQVQMSPFWQRTFPENPDEIVVREELIDPEAEEN